MEARGRSYLLDQGKDQGSVIRDQGSGSGDRKIPRRVPASFGYFERPAAWNDPAAGTGPFANEGPGHEPFDTHWAQARRGCNDYPGRRAPSPSVI